MSKAPEWIYLDGDVQAGDGMFPRCFEDPKYASDPPIEYGRIDLLEAAEQRGYANAMEAERKIHADRIEELEAEIARLRQLVPRPDQTRDELVWRDHMRGVPLEALAKEFSVTRERMRQMLKRITERRLHLEGKTDK